MFVFRPDGQWVDFNAYACQGKPEAFDEVVFPTMPDVMAAFGRLAGRARVLNLPIDAVGLKAWIERQKGLTPVQAMRGWALKYKQRHGGVG